MRAFIFALLALFAAHSAALAEERIEQFTSDARVNVDGSVDVTETISVNAEVAADQARHLSRFSHDLYGPERPAGGCRLRGDLGEARQAREPYAIEGLSNGKRIRIGSADVFLDHGIHVYEIQYRTTRQLGFFAAL